MKKKKADETYRIIYLANILSGVVGEGRRKRNAQGFFEIVGKKLTLISCWDCNDAYYRSEYMDGLLSHLGVMVEPLPAKYEEEALQRIKDSFGL